MVILAIVVASLASVLVQATKSEVDAGKRFQTQEQDQSSWTPRSASTSGSQASGPFEGLTIWQDSSLALDTADSCNSKNNHSTPSQANINTYDIALMSAASTGVNGSLGSISGSIYAPANRADFVEALSGTANLAVLTSCIMVNGGSSTFAFNPSGLLGAAWVLGPQAG